MRRLVPVLLLLVMTMACGLEGAKEAASSIRLKQLGLALQNHHDTLQPVAAGESGAAQPADAGTAAQPTAGRRIIYRASINLHVKSFAEADRRISTLLNDAGGYVAQFNEDRSYGTQRGGRWAIRVPAARFNWFLDEVGQLGVAERREVQSQDMTEEFVDLGARLKNKQALESRLLEIVSKRGDEIKDVLALEAELSRVREEIERLQGRLRFLTDRVSLTTIEISAYERLDYQPPEATFRARIASTFWLSLDRLRQSGEATALVLTALAPWAVVAALVLLPIGVIVRGYCRRHPGISVAARLE
jgi:uncharacterized protein DUF4349